MNGNGGQRAYQILADPYGAKTLENYLNPAAFVLPEGIVPSRSSLPGIVSGHRWRATYSGIPPDGVTWHASFKPGFESKLPGTAAILLSHRYPGGDGWQSLPAWLPQEHTVWRMDAFWVLPAPATIAPVPVLR